VEIAPTDRTTVHRLAHRATYDRRAINAILDEGLVAHLGLAPDGQPLVLPTLHARVGDEVFVHGSVANRMLRSLRDGAPACLTVSIVDGLVLARSWFHHSVNYRSVVIFGQARLVEDDDRKRAAMAALVEHVAPGRGGHSRPPTAKELAATLVLSLPIDEVSAKIRTGPPIDDEEDLTLDVWAGVLPLALVPGPAMADDASAARQVPEHVQEWSRPG
jgi:nitroimidazol reductase NimA-like FMN-containing flavoprotein (pyridoxamine 5'-phosphate oxidase superfamily)